jgi:hypothetical protein
MQLKMDSTRQRESNRVRFVGHVPVVHVHCFLKPTGVFGDRMDTPVYLVPSPHTTLLIGACSCGAVVQLSLER